jgi:hypothetical protein
MNRVFVKPTAPKPVISERCIFVFGSNLAGRHGAGSALAARRFHGAIYGRGVGLQGNSYAIPTKDDNLRPLKLEVIKGFVSDFITFTDLYQNWRFRVVRVGCGYAGFSDEEMAPLFLLARSRKNIELHTAWRRILDHAQHE